MNKKILFLSALDFKEKSIQVIRKTPEAYVGDGWAVKCIVARDTVKNGNYYYEKIININGATIERFVWPLVGIRNNLRSRLSKLLLNKLSGLFVVMKLILLGFKSLRNDQYDIIYGYEFHGVLAVKILKILGVTRASKVVSRFQGTFLNEMISLKQYLRLLFNIDHCLALRSSCDLCIMTNDGTQGDKAIKKIALKNYPLLKFWVNGVDNHVPDHSRVKSIKAQFHLDETPVFMSVSRLTTWKRVDRAIRVLSILKTDFGICDFKYLIIGEGDERESLNRLVCNLGLSDNVVFIGSIANSEVKNYLEAADYFISTYEHSNVGNPLLEAIRANKIIFTINNGDTGSWIKHQCNGFIYEEDENLCQNMANDIANIIKDNQLSKSIADGVYRLQYDKLWTWEERFEEEIKTVKGLFCHEN